MIQRSPLIPERVRRIGGSFAFIEHRFLRDRFWESLTVNELLLYFFLVLVCDRQGLSFYHFDKICSLLCMSLDHYLAARDALIEKDLLAFNGQIYQVLSLPKAPRLQSPGLLEPGRNMENRDGATIRQLIRRSFMEQP